jgi:hypothetical protein
VIWSRELGHRLKGTGVTSNSLEPGIVATSLSKGITDDPAMARRLENGVCVEKGASTQVFLASSAECAGITGEHWQDCAVISRGLATIRYLMAAHELRASAGPRLWAFIEATLAPALSKLEAHVATLESGPPLTPPPVVDTSQSADDEEGDESGGGGEAAVLAHLRASGIAEGGLLAEVE